MKFLQAWYHLQMSMYFPFHHPDVTGKAYKFWTLGQISAFQFHNKAFTSTLAVGSQLYKPPLQQLHLVHISWEHFEKVMWINVKTPALSTVISWHSFSQTQSALGFAYQIL